ncbi:hypothetical protein [Streptomyces sp. Ac-502]|uniref:hypothetical protein n=1 Tax=Streptomyces sp. Ac-502 TaxID=3342801 RepID=UPI0038623895
MSILTALGLCFFGLALLAAAHRSAPRWIAAALLSGSSTCAAVTYAADRNIAWTWTTLILAVVLACAAAHDLLRSRTLRKTGGTR